MERIYNIPLRKEFQKVPNYKRASKARRAVREFLIKHMKTKEVKIGKYLNEEIWKNGPKNPPHKVNVKAVKEEDIVRAELVGAPVEAPEPKKEEKKSVKDKLEEKVKETKTEPKKKEEKTPTAKELAEKKETKVKKEAEKKVPKAAELKEKKTSKK
jgi:large subunit ribosomal protein L31e